VSESALIARSDTKDARIRGRDGPYQYASEPISVVESDRLSNAWTQRLKMDMENTEAGDDPRAGSVARFGLIDDTLCTLVAIVS
jgi:hypothetical protein